MKLLLITQNKRGAFELKPEHREKIQQTVPDLDIVAVTDPADAARELTDADILAGFPAFMPDIAGGKNLKWIHSFSAGMDRVLTPEIINSSIAASNSAGIHA